MGRPSNRAQRRRTIRKALLRVMAKKGYERASIADIAAEAELSPGLLHYHFKSKQEILLSLIERMYAHRQRAIEATVEGAGGDPLAELGAFVDNYLDLSAADPDALAAWTAMGTEALRDPDVRQRFGEVLQGSASRLQLTIQRGVAAGIFFAPDVGAAVAAVMALIQGYFFLAATAGRLIPPESAAPCAKRMVLGLLATAPP